MVKLKTKLADPKQIALYPLLNRATCGRQTSQSWRKLDYMTSNRNKWAAVRVSWRHWTRLWWSLTISTLLCLQYKWERRGHFIFRQRGRRNVRNWGRMIAGWTWDAQIWSNACPNSSHRWIDRCHRQRRESCRIKAGKKKLFRGSTEVNGDYVTLSEATILTENQPTSGDTHKVWQQMCAVGFRVK